MTDQETYDRTLDEPSSPWPTAAQPVQQVAPEPRRQNNRRAIGLVLLIIGGLWLLGSLGSQAPWQPFGGAGRDGMLLEQNYLAERLELDVSTGSVEITSWDEPTIAIEAHYQGGSPDDYEVQVIDSNTGTVRVSGGPKACFGFCVPRDVQYIIRVPSGTDASIETVNGAISIADVSGEVVLRSVNGDINAQGVSGGLVAGTTNGEIELERIGGKLDANSTNGSIILQEGSLSAAKVETINGSIELSGVSGEIEAESTNGSISVSEATNAELALRNVNGDIDYEGSLAESVTHIVSSEFGDIRLELPENSSFKLEASSVGGDIETDFDLANQEQSNNNLRGQVSSGSSTLKISSTNGDVRVEQR